MDDLILSFSTLIDRVSTLKSKEELPFYEGIFPSLNSSYSTDQIVIQKDLITFEHSRRFDRLHFYGYPKAYMGLALLILAVVFNQKVCKTNLILTHSSSQIRKVVIENWWHRNKEDYGSGYHEIPYLFNYSPKDVDEFPFLHKLSKSEIANSPTIQLTNENDNAVTDKDFAKRNIVHGFGTPKGCTSFAELLLNITNPIQKKVDFSLENELGLGGVASGSDYVRLSLPGFYSWPDGL